MSKKNKTAKPVEVNPQRNSPKGDAKSAQPDFQEIMDKANKALAKAGKDGKDRKPCFNRNAIQWHNKDSVLWQMASHISQFKLGGKQITPTSNPEVATFGNRISLYEMAITPGTVLGTSDPFNKAMIELFTQVRGKYTSNIPFQANDLGAVILAVANVISLISCMDRVIDMLGYVSFKSTLTPEILHAACVGDVNNATIKAGYDQDVFDSPNLKLALEYQIRRLQGLFMPKMALFDFAGWIYRHVFFEDKTGLRGDISMFKPSYIAKFNPAVAVIGATGVYASGLEYRDINSYLSSPNPHDARIYLSAISDCIDALMDDNVRTICGWLHQYLPDSPTIADIVQQTRQTAPEENPEMDLFISGLTFVPASNFTSTYVQQDVTNECLVFSMLSSTPRAPITDWMINYDHVPTDDEVGMSMIFTALNKGGYVYSDPFVATKQLIYRRTVAGSLIVVQTDREFNIASYTIAAILSFHEGLNPTSVIYRLNSGGAVDQMSLYADCAYQVRITPENAYNVHYASLVSLLSVEGSVKTGR